MACAIIRIEEDGATEGELNFSISFGDNGETFDENAPAHRCAAAIAHFVTNGEPKNERIIRADDTDSEGGEL